MREYLNITDGAEVNVQADYNQTDQTADDFIRNKPAINLKATSADLNGVSIAANSYVAIPFPPGVTSTKIVNVAVYWGGAIAPVYCGFSSDGINLCNTMNYNITGIPTCQMIVYHY